MDRSGSGTVQQPRSKTKGTCDDFSEIEHEGTAYPTTAKIYAEQAASTTSTKIRNDSPSQEISRVESVKEHQLGSGRDGNHVESLKKENEDFLKKGSDRVSVKIEGLDEDVVSSNRSDASITKKVTPEERIFNADSSSRSFRFDRYKTLLSSIPDGLQSVITTVRDVPLITRSFSSISSSSIYGSSKSLVSSIPGQMKVVETVLRFGGVVLSLITFSVMAATSQHQTGAGSSFRMKFSDYQAYSYVVALNIITFLYSCWHLILAQSSDFTAYSSYNKLLFRFACDQVLAILLFSTSTAAATAAQLSHHGLRNIWPPACSTWDLTLFCSKADAAVVLSFFTSFFVISSAILSGYKLSKYILD